MNSYHPVADIWTPDGALWLLETLLVTLCMALLGYCIKTRRERAAEKKLSNQRRVAFVAYIRGWEAAYEKPVMEAIGYRPNVPAFVQSIPEFVSSAEMIRPDIPNDRISEFDSLVSIVRKSGPSDMYGDKYKNLCKSIDRLVAIARP